MDPRIEASLARALDTGDFRDLLERAAPGMGLPGPRPRLELSREIGHAIARERARGSKLARSLAASEREEAKLVAAAAFAASLVSGGGRAEPLAALQELAEDPRAVVRIGVIDAVRTFVTADVAAGIAELAAWTDGFLQAHVALEALVDRQILANLPGADAVRPLLDAAFHLADAAPRAADRWQGVRVLRQGLPAQIAAFVGRFSELFAWLLERAAATRPETREVLEATAEALLRASFRRTDVEVLRAALAKSAKAPRDPSRIVHGTRKRSRR
jgi:hypothetical protein